MRPAGVRSTVHPSSDIGCEILAGPEADALNTAIAPAALVRSTCSHASAVVKWAVCSTGAVEFPEIIATKINVYTVDPSRDIRARSALLKSRIYGVTITRTAAISKLNAVGDSIRRYTPFRLRTAPPRTGRVRCRVQLSDGPQGRSANGRFACH